jgi:hypothetical protein
VDIKGIKISDVDINERKYVLDETPRKLTLNSKLPSVAGLYFNIKVVIDRVSLDYLMERDFSGERFTERGQCEISNVKLNRKI